MRTTAKEASLVRKALKNGSIFSGNQPIVLVLVKSMSSKNISPKNIPIPAANVVNWIKSTFPAKRSDFYGIKAIAYEILASPLDLPGSVGTTILSTTQLW